MARTSKKKKFESYDGSFYWLADSIAEILKRNKLEGTSQKEQVEELFLAEKLFKEEILKYKYSNQIYKRFIQKIKVEDRNILYSKPYFRESAITFSKKITPCLKNDDTDGLKKFNINFQLIQFIKNNWRGPLGVKAERLFQRVRRAREVLMENNLPLVINAAKLFYRKVPRSDLTLMDMISTATTGLSIAIDKYCGDKTGKYSEVFRSVILGRATGNLIRDYSATQLHFYPSDRKVLYRSNTIRGRQGITEINELTAAVNASFEADKLEGKNVPKHKIVASDLQYLLNASSMVSVENTVDENDFNAYDRTPDDKVGAEESIIDIETKETVSRLIKELPVLHRKILRLKGIFL
jgi:DNA-directed RNA polymerase specialized sigma subunit